MKHLTCLSEITNMPAIKQLVYAFNEDSCADVCAEFGVKGCINCPIQEAINELYDYQKILFDSKGNPRISLGKLESLVIEGVEEVIENPDFKVGDLVLYQNSIRVQIGKIKSLCLNGAFVYYNEGDTAAKTPYSRLRKIDNSFCIKTTSLGKTNGASNMAISRFYPGLYSSFLAGHIQTPPREDLCNMTLTQIYRSYPKYSLFMSLHVGQAFRDDVIEANVKAISEIPYSDLLMSLGQDEDGTPMFYITIRDLKTKYGIETEGEKDSV